MCKNFFWNSFILHKRNKICAYAIILALFTLIYEFILRLFYSIIFTLLLPLILLRLCWRGFKAPAYFRRWGERFAFYKNTTIEHPVIWVHAVSVGEVEATRPLISDLKQNYPSHRILITTMTPTGSDRVKRLYEDKVAHVFLPYDLPFCASRFIKHWQPVLGIIMETEIWPNLIHHAHLNNVELVLANARMSAKSAQGYAKLTTLTAQTLQKFTFIAAQTQSDRKRLIDLGAQSKNVHSIGSLKFDITVPDVLIEQADSMREMWGSRSVLIAGSTHEGEDEIILNACRKIKSEIANFLLILVPRHPERFDRVTALCRKNGYKTIRRSEKDLCRSDVDVLVVDTMGELPLFYAASDIALVCGSLLPIGGHNLLEPAALGRAILTGPHYFNFKEITQKFIDSTAAQIVEDRESLANITTALFQQTDRRQQMGLAALNLVKQNQGASHRLLNLLKRHTHV